MESVLRRCLSNLNQLDKYNEYLEYLNSEWYIQIEDLQVAIEVSIRVVFFSLSIILVHVSEWYLFRNNLITASNAYKIFDIPDP